MKRITLNISDQVVDEYCKKYGYLPFLPDPKDPTSPSQISNPIDKIGFIKYHLANRIQEVEMELAAKQSVDEQYNRE